MKLSFTLSNDTYFLPQCWEDMTFHQYCQYLEIQTDEDLSGFDKAARSLAVLSDIPLETLYQSEAKLVTLLFDHLTFLQTPPETPKIKEVTILGNTYEPQSLVKYGELALFDKIQSMSQDDISKKYPLILALLLRKKLEITPEPEKKPLWKRVLGGKTVPQEPKFLMESFTMDTEHLQKRAELFRSTLNPVQVLSLIAFFLPKEKQSTENIGHYSHLQRELQHQTENMVLISTANTDGWPLFTRLLRMYVLTLNYYNSLQQTS